MKNAVVILLCLLFPFLTFANTKNFDFGSPVFDADSFIPEKYTCEGANLSPAFYWGNPPANTKSFVIIIDDLETGNDPWVHWVLFNIPANIRNLTEGEIPHGAVNGKNSWGLVGYKGPCPPSGTSHRYLFKLYALDIMLPLTSSATKEEVVKAMEYHVVGMSEFAGNFSRE
ncbi:YbhB/YbcL family Raf kinase inhibitor-like protein [Legionella clemsonensis]|uniref:Putative kinase inhibitor protein n=1 Tax=Legionella clemsonensis TaxID=1867846 RepID=A0A222P4Y4_9GAMM|nr:YbhB/YbcL family Raf kinase inhibitor-like protein [Legionella clemsonensis]ASQ46906.1 putative kinase inhibitor protein [Legionella clemsonensis]